MHGHTTESPRPTIVRWMMGLVRPVEPYGDYFVRLERSVASSAPLCTTCG
jgi:hypothetical protein